MRCGLSLLVLLLAGIAAAMPCQAYQLRDGLFFSMPQDSMKSVEVLLPNDFGLAAGRMEFRITTDTNWSDITVTDQIVRTDENNTALIPVEFRSFGARNGTCSPYTIRVESTGTGEARSWSGGVCVSEFPDVDMLGPGQGAAPAGEPLWESQDLFAVGLSSASVLAGPGETVNVTVQVESYANVRLDVSMGGTGLSVSPQARSVSLGSGNPTEGLAFQVAAPEKEGTYPFVAKASGTCGVETCERTAEGALTVSRAGIQSGFSASIFPETISVRDLSPVNFTLTVYNYGDEARTFTTFIRTLQPGLSSDFYASTLSVDGGQEKAVRFSVTPEKAASFFEFEAGVESGGDKRTLTATISTDEMMTDAVSRAESVKDGASAQVKQQVDSALDSWYESYKGSAQGEEGQAWQELQSELDAAERLKAQQATPADNQSAPDVVIGGNGPSSGGGEWVVYAIIILLAAVGAIGALAFRLLRRPGKEETFREFVS
jgi:hypothetical protein